MNENYRMENRLCTKSLITEHLLNASSFFSVVTSLPQKEKRKKIVTREKGSACHLTSPEQNERKKKALERNKSTGSHHIESDEKRKRRRSITIQSSTSTSFSEEFSQSSDEDNMPCGFCGMRYLE
ncbi:hypothetical protein PR048_014543, partial [Dryococelus australis]